MKRAIPFSLILLFSSSVALAEVRGLEGIPLDSWTEAFFAPASTSTSAPAPLPDEATLKAQLLEAFKNAKDTRQFYEAIAKLGYARASLQTDEQVRLARALLSARQVVRQIPRASKPELVGSLQLLQALADETLFTLEMKQPGQVSQVKIVFDEKTAEQTLPKGSSVRETRLLGVPLWQGDILLSKGDAGSSEFLARVEDIPGNYSHATVAYIDPTNGRLLFPEAEIDDGVKLRDPAKDYINPPGKRRLSVFRRAPSARAERNETAARAAAGVDSMVSMMRQRVSDPEKEASFKYNFSMYADGNLNPDALFCTETACLPNDLGGVTGAEHPYPKERWSQVTGVRKDLFRDFFNIPSNTFPAPSDLERNPFYEMVATIVDVPSLAKERVDAAMIDALVEILEANPEIARELLASLRDYGNDAITPQHWEAIEKLGVFPPEKLAQIRKAVPENINLKQLAFFGYLNQVLTPKVREAFSAAQAAKLAQTGRPLGPQELRVAFRAQVEQSLKEAIGKFTTVAKAAGLQVKAPCEAHYGKL